MPNRTKQVDIYDCGHDLPFISCYHEPRYQCKDAQFILNPVPGDYGCYNPDVCPDCDYPGPADFPSSPSLLISLPMRLRPEHGVGREAINRVDPEEIEWLSAEVPMPPPSALLRGGRSQGLRGRRERLTPSTSPHQNGHVTSLPDSVDGPSSHTQSNSYGSSKSPAHKPSSCYAHSCRSSSPESPTTTRTPTIHIQPASFPTLSEPPKLENGKGRQTSVDTVRSVHEHRAGSPARFTSPIPLCTKKDFLAHMSNKTAFGYPWNSSTASEMQRPSPASPHTADESPRKASKKLDSSQVPSTPSRNTLNLTPGLQRALGNAFAEMDFVQLDI